MTASSGKTGRGVTLEIGNGLSPQTWTPIANLTSANLSGRDADEIDFTTLASTGGFRELRQGFKDPGSIACEYHFDPTNPTHVDLSTKFLSGDLFNFRINYSAAGWAYAEVGEGFVKNPGDRSHNVNDPIQGTATIRITGATSLDAVP